MSKKVKIIIRNLTDANDMEIASHLKFQGIDKKRAWSEYVKIKSLSPKIDASDFYEIYNEVRPIQFRRRRIEGNVQATHLLIHNLPDNVSFARRVVITNETEGSLKYYEPLTGSTGGIPKRVSDFSITKLENLKESDIIEKEIKSKKSQLKWLLTKENSNPISKENVEIEIKNLQIKKIEQEKKEFKKPPTKEEVYNAYKKIRANQKHPDVFIQDIEKELNNDKVFETLFELDNNLLALLVPSRSSPNFKTYVGINGRRYSKVSLDDELKEVILKDKKKDIKKELKDLEKELLKYPPEQWDQKTPNDLRIRYEQLSEEIKEVYGYSLEDAEAQLGLTPIPKKKKKKPSINQLFHREVIIASNLCQKGTYKRKLTNRAGVEIMQCKLKSCVGEKGSKVCDLVIQSKLYSKKFFKRNKQTKKIERRM